MHSSAGLEPVLQQNRCFLKEWGTLGRDALGLRPSASVSPLHPPSPLLSPFLTLQHTPFSHKTPFVDIKNRTHLNQEQSTGSEETE